MGIEIDADGKVKYSNGRKYAPLKGSGMALQSGSKNANQSTTAKKKKRTWFDAGAFDDGWQPLDLIKTIRATGKDVNKNLTKGALGLVETAIDTTAFHVGAAGGMLGAKDFQKGVNDFVKKDLINEDTVAKVLLAPIYMDGITGIEAGLEAANNSNSVEDALKNISGVKGIKQMYESAWDEDENSVLGDKADSLVQSGGQMLATRGLNAWLGIPWQATTGVASFGSSVEEALNEGASSTEAYISSLVSSSAEILTEMLFAGSGLGESGLIKLDGLTKGISNKIVKTLVDFGVDIFAEGSEEVLTEFTSNVGKQLTYEREDTLEELFTNEEAFDNYIKQSATNLFGKEAREQYGEAFIGGAFLGGGANVVKAGQSLDAENIGKEGWNPKDYRTGFTSNEQKLFDEEVKKRLESKDNQLTKKQIEQEVFEEIERGEFELDVINKTFGGELYAELDTLIKESNEYEELLDIPDKELTGRQRKRLSELEAKNSEQSFADRRTEAMGQLTDNVKNATKGDRYIQGVFAERAKRGETFSVSEEELSKYSGKGRETIQKAIDSGSINNTRRAREFVERLAKISEDKGIVFDFTDSKKISELGYSIEGKIVNGYIQGENVTLNLNSAQALNKVVGHEVTHFLEGTEHYEALQQAMEEYVNLKGEGEYNKRLAELTERYRDVKDADAKKELLADLVGEYLFTDEKFVSHLSTKNRNVFQKIYDEIKYLVKTFYGTKEGKQLEKVKKIFEQVYKESSKQEKTDNIKYSLVGVDKNGIEIYETSEETKKLSYTERKAKLLDLMKNEYAGRTAKFTKNGQVYYAQYNAAGLNKGVYGDKKSEHKGYNAKINIGADGNYIELAENAIYKGSSAEYGKANKFHSDAKVWDYYAKTIQSDGVYFDVLINVKDTGNEQFVYDITLKEATHQRALKHLQLGEAASTSSISQKQQNTTQNQKKSLSDNAIAPEPAGGWNVKGKDIAFEAPIAEKFAPAQEVQDDLAQGPFTTPEDKGEQEITSGEEDIIQFRKANAQKIKNIETKIQGLKMSKDITQREFSDSIAKKQQEYDNLSRKDTAKASKLLEQINNLEYRRDQTIAELDRKIEGSQKAMQNIKNQEVARQRKLKQNLLRNFVSDLMGDTSSWKDKKQGISYQVNTLRRNLRDVVRDADGKRNIEKADEIYDALQGRYNQNEANLNREANRIKKTFSDMKINAVENVYIQMLGEYRHNPDTTISSEVIQEFYEKNKSKIGDKKVDKAIELSRKLYDSLFHRLNSVLREQGMKEIGYREGYFPHFTQEKQGLFGKIFNWKTQNNDIPTDIAGLTEQFNPNRSWQSFNKHRTGDNTDYNFKRGLDTYVNGALDWIYHIEDIQTRRAFENEIRYRHSEKGIQDKIDEIYNNPFYDADEVQAKIDEVLKEANNPLNNFVTDLRKGTNVLAGKKDSGDRFIEEKTSRKIYSTMTNISNRVTANMVVGSISSALTNFIPITQSWGQVSPIRSLQGMKDTIKSTVVDDGMVEKSTFLTNRLRQAEKLYKDAWDHIGDKAGFLMEAVDSFTSQTVWRSKYIDNIAKGMTEEAAIKDADQFAENVIAGRSRGNMPTIFNEKNLATKMLTAFQLEVVNQYGYMFKDMPQDMRNEATWKLVKGYASMYIGAYAYNALYSTLTGRDAAFDPIGILEDLFRDLGLFDDDEEKELAEVITNLATNVVEEIPFVGGLVGGGRIPISSALPYDGFTVDSLSQMMSDLSEGDMDNFWKEMFNPVYYVGIPMGGGQVRKTIYGVKMFDDDLPIAGSYTNSGNLRYSVEDTPLNRLQAAVFGQYANKNARKYFDEGRAPLNEKKTQELADLEIPISEYWDIQDKLKGKDKIADKADVISDLDLPIAKKNLLINNATDRKDPIDLTDYKLYEDFEEFDFATKNVAKYDFLKSNNVSYKEYKSSEEKKEAYDWAYEYPKAYKVSKAVTDDVVAYKRYMSELNEIRADKKNGKTVSGSAKQKKLNYINSLDLDYSNKIVLWKSLYPSDNTYNHQIVQYVIGRKDFEYQDKVDVLRELGFDVSNGQVRW